METLAACQRKMAAAAILREAAWGFPLPICSPCRNANPPTPDAAKSWRTVGCSHLYQPTMKADTSRRAFLKSSAVAAAAVAALGACDTKAQNGPAQATKGPPTGGTLGPHDTGVQSANGAMASATMSNADKMDAMHEAGVKAFPAKTEGLGNQLLRPRI